MGFLSEKLSFDFGTSCIRIVKDGKVVVKEDCRIETDKNVTEILTFGNDVSVPTNNRILYPVRGGMIADFNGFEQLLRNSIKKLPNRRRVFPPQLTTLALVHESSTEIELHAGSRNTFMLYSSFAAVEGMGLDKKGTYLLIDAGAGKISMTIFSSDNLYCPHRVCFGGMKLMEIIGLYLKQEHNVECRSVTLEEILRTYVSCSGNLTIKNKRISCSNKNGDFVAFDLDVQALNKKLNPYLQQMDDEISLTIEQFKKEINKPIQSVVIIGGLARVKGFEKRISQLTNLQVMDKSDKDYTLAGLKVFDRDFEKNTKTLR